MTDKFYEKTLATERKYNGLLKLGIASIGDLWHAMDAVELIGLARST